MFLALSNTGCPGENKQETAPKKKQAVEVGPGGKLGPNGGNNIGRHKALKDNGDLMLTLFRVALDDNPEVALMDRKIDTMLSDYSGDSMQLLASHIIWNLASKDDFDEQEAKKILENLKKSKLKGHLQTALNKTMIDQCAIDQEIHKQRCLVTLVEKLLKLGAEINAKEVSSYDKNYKRTALHSAAMAGRVEMVKLLLRNGATTTIKDSGKRSEHTAQERVKQHILKQYQSNIICCKCRIVSLRKEKLNGYEKEIEKKEEEIKEYELKKAPYDQIAQLLKKAAAKK